MRKLEKEFDFGRAISPETKEALRLIDENIRRAMLLAPFIIVGLSRGER